MDDNLDNDVIEFIDEPVQAEAPLIDIKHLRYIDLPINYDVEKRMLLQPGAAAVAQLYRNAMGQSSETIFRQIDNNGIDINSEIIGGLTEKDDNDSP